MTGPVLQVQGLQVQRGGRPVLQGLDLCVQPGQRVALTGASGWGKSTLLQAVLGLLPVQAGLVRWFGRPCRSEADFAAVRRQVGLLFQSSDDQLLCPRVIDDVAFGPLNLGWSAHEALRQAQAQLAALGIEHLQHRPVHELSGGEARRVALAGVLAMQPQVLLLDEPTAGLDADARALMLVHLDAHCPTLVLASHDAEAVARLCAQPCQALQRAPAAPGDGHRPGRCDVCG